MRFPPYWSEKLNTWIIEDEAVRPGTYVVMAHEPPIPREWPAEEDDDA